MRCNDRLKRTLEDGQQLADWLHPHQLDGIKFGVGKRGVLLCYPTGAGKTATATVLACRDTRSQRTVVICRTDVKTSVWLRTLQRMTTYRCQVIWSAKDTIDPETEVVIINWELLKPWRNQLSRWLGHGMLIVDEMHWGKAWRRVKKVIDPMTKLTRKKPVVTRASVMAELAHQAQYVVGLTATPVANNRMDYWSILNALDPERWKNSWWYAHRYCAATPAEYGGLDTSGHSNDEEFRRRISHYVHQVHKEDILDVYNTMRRETIWLDQRELGRASAFADLLKKAAGADHVWLKLARASSRKRKWALERAKFHMEEGDRTVWGLGLQSEVELLGKRFEKEFGKHAVRYSHGGTSPAERAAQLEWYLEPSDHAKFLVVSIKAWGESVDGLQCSNAAYTLHLPFRPIDMIQWDGRFQRAGGGTECTVYTVIAPGTYDEAVQEIILSKMDVLLSTYDDTDAQSITDELSKLGDEEAIVEAILDMF